MEPSLEAFLDLLRPLLSPQLRPLLLLVLATAVLIPFAARVGMRLPIVLHWVPARTNFETRLHIVPTSRAILRLGRLVRALLAGPSLCLVCATPLPWWTGLPLAGLVAPCGRCLRLTRLPLVAAHVVFIPALILGYRSGGLGAALCASAAVLLAVALAYGDLRAHALPALLLAPFLWLGLLASPFASLPDRVFGAAFLFCAAGAIVLVGALRASAPTAAAFADDPIPDPLEGAVGGGDLLLGCALGAWLGALPALLVACLSLLALAPKRTRRPAVVLVPLAPALLLVAGLWLAATLVQIHPTGAVGALSRDVAALLVTP